MIYLFYELNINYSRWRLYFLFINWGVVIMCWRWCASVSVSVLYPFTWYSRCTIAWWLKQPQSWYFYAQLNKVIVYITLYCMHTILIKICSAMHLVELLTFTKYATLISYTQIFKRILPNARLNMRKKADVQWQKPLLTNHNWINEHHILHKLLDHLNLPAQFMEWNSWVITQWTCL